LILTGVVGFGHELRLDERIEPDGVWVFEATMEAEPLAEASFQVTTADDQVLLSGALSADGGFRWRPGAQKSFKVVINAGLGHRLEETYDRVGQSGQPSGAETGGLASASADHMDVGGHSHEAEDEIHGGYRTWSISLQGPLLGVALLLGACGLWLSWRNTQRLNRLEGSGRDHAGRD